jgi:hypothetical protein
MSGDEIQRGAFPGMNERGETSCEQLPAGQAPALVGIGTMPGIELGEPLFLPSLLPCCAQLALPFMAKIIGAVRNCTGADLMVRVTALLLDADGARVAEYSEVLALDADEKGQFEVKLIELPDEVRGYRISAEKYDE